MSAATVVSLSGERTKGTRRVTSPQVLLVSAERDLDYVREGTPTLAAALRAGGIAVETWRVPGAAHFCPARASAVDRSGRSSSVEVVVGDFLSRAFR